MCAELEKWRLEERAEGRAEGKIETALVMLKDHLPMEMIARYTDLSMDTIAHLAKQNHLA